MIIKPALCIFLSQNVFSFGQTINKYDHMNANTKAAKHSIILGVIIAKFFHSVVLDFIGHIFGAYLHNQPTVLVTKRAALLENIIFLSLADKI